MLITLPKEELEKLLQEEIQCWHAVGGVLNPHAYEFDPLSADPKQLEELGYYSDRESWIASARVKTLEQFLKDLHTYPTKE
jgi:hypothetical protein